MGIFDGVLICSDIDGTLAVNGSVPEENVKYIKYFMENGGLFTVATGRCPRYVSVDKFGFVPNTYGVVINGTVISSFDEKEIIYDSKIPAFLANEIVNYAKNLWKNFDYRASDILHQENILGAPIDYNTNKIVFIPKDESTALDMILEIPRKFKGKVQATRSWPTGVEITSADSGKGVCVKKLKNFTGAKLLICVGDFENDIDMLKAADISYAVGNAAECIKKVADRITVECSKSAIAQIIKITEQQLMEK